MIQHSGPFLDVGNWNQTEGKPTVWQVVLWWVADSGLSNEQLLVVSPPCVGDNRYPWADTDSDFLAVLQGNSKLVLEWLSQFCLLRTGLGVSECRMRAGLPQVALRAQTQPELLLGYDGFQMGFSPKVKKCPPPRVINLIRNDIILSFRVGW